MPLRASGWAPGCTGSRTESAASPGHPAPEYVLDRGCERRGDATVPFRGEVKRIQELVRPQQVVQVDVRQPALRGVRLQPLQELRQARVGDANVVARPV